MSKVTVSIVLYNSNPKEIKDIIYNFDSNILIFLIDNSPTISHEFLAISTQVQYIHNPSNPGFGSSHNYALKKSIEMESDFHFIVNPDVYFERDVIKTMINVMEKDYTIGMMMPQILNFDGTIQNLPKLLPSPISILFRKIKKPKALYNKFIERYELRNLSKDRICNVPLISGCFTLLNLSAIKEVGMYDDRFFMYFEDWDLSRRVHNKYKTIFFPLVSIYHKYDSGANKNINLLVIFIKSACIYFTKWGWFFDNERKLINKKILSQFN